MTARQSLYVLALHGAIALAVVVSATVLGVQGTLDSTALTAIYGAALGFAGAAGSATAAVGQAVNGKALIPSSELANREDTLRAAFASTAASPAHQGPPEPARREEPGG